MKYYYNDGKLYSEGNYQHAIKNGEWKYYDRNGKTEKKEIYKLGVLQGEEAIITKKEFEEMKQKSDTTTEK